MNAKEFPKLNDYSAAFRYTLKIRVVSDGTLPKVKSIKALTDSQDETRTVHLAWAKAPPTTPQVTLFNGQLTSCKTSENSGHEITFKATVNPEPSRR